MTSGTCRRAAYGVPHRGVGVRERQRLPNRWVISRCSEASTTEVQDGLLAPGDAHWGQAVVPHGKRFQTEHRRTSWGGRPEHFAARPPANGSAPAPRLWGYPVACVRNSSTR
jgi:hypothetical protein